MTSDARGRPLTLDDTSDILRLYATLVASEAFPDDCAAADHLRDIIDHPGTTLFGAEVAGQVHAMCTLHILPNMTRNRRPYALIENVVSAVEWRGQGLARLAMATAIDAAWQAACYKVMLLSGSVDGHGFYPRLGFDGDAKRGFILRNPATLTQPE